MKYVLHVFWFGNTQLIQGATNKTVKSSVLTTLAAFIAAVKAKKPAGMADSDYHAINVFDGMRIDFLSKDGKDKTFSVEWKDVDAPTLTALVAEVTAAVV